MTKCTECHHQAGYLGNNEELGDYDLCACCWSDRVADECAERYPDEAEQIFARAAE